MKILEKKPKRRAAECRAGDVLVNRRNRSNRQDFCGFFPSPRLTIFVALLQAMSEGIVPPAIKEFSAK
jgi:hypothetical protein